MQLSNSGSSSSILAQKWALNETSLNNLLKKVETGDYTSFNKILSVLTSESHSHPFLKEASNLCGRIIPYLEKGLENQKISAEMVNKTIKNFAKFNVFQSLNLEENVIFKCSNGSVTMSKSILTLSNDYYKTLFSSKFKESQPDKDHKYPLDYAIFSKEAVAQLKEFIYTQNLDNVKNLTTPALFDLCQLAQMHFEEKIEKECRALIDVRATNIRTENEAIQFLKLLEKKPDLSIKLEQSCLEASLKSLDIRVQKDPCLVLDAEFCNLLNNNESELLPYLRKWIIGLEVNLDNFEHLQMLRLLCPEALENIQVLNVTRNFPFAELEEVISSLPSLKMIRFKIDDNSSISNNFAKYSVLDDALEKKIPIIIHIFGNIYRSDKLAEVRLDYIPCANNLEKSNILFEYSSFNSESKELRRIFSEKEQKLNKLKDEIDLAKR